MEAKKSSWWQQIKQHPVATVLIALLYVVIVLIILSILGYILHWGWTGLGTYISPPYPKDSTFQRGKTLWDWLQLLIIPAVLVVAGYVINQTISRGEQAATEQRAKSEREAAKKRAETEREIAFDNQRETALKEYIDKMSELILHEGLLESDPKKEVREIAQIQTLTVLNRLDGKRKGSVVKFLNDAGLIKKDKTIIDLQGANLSEADLCQAHLNGARLYGVDLGKADLSGAYLGLTPFGVPDNWIDEAIENGQDVLILDDCDLRRANLSGAYLFATHLNQADLTRANLSNANLGYTDLTDANLIGADISNTVLDKNSDDYKSGSDGPDLQGATMPDGSKHP